MTKVISLRKNKTHRNKLPIKKDNNLIKNIGENKFKIAFLIASLISILIGAVSYKLITNTQITNIIASNMQVLSNGKFKETFIYLLKFDLSFLLLNFFIGTSFIGSSLSFLSPMLKCLYIGYFSGYLYNEFELKGVLFCLLLLYPCFAITTTSLIFSSNENIYMSKYIFNCLNGKTSIDNISIRLYLIRYLLLLAINLSCIGVTSLVISFVAPKLNII